VTTGNEPQYEVPTWSEIYEMLLHLSQKIRANGFKADLIIGITRGGLVPARILSDLIETQSFSNIQIEYYQGINQTKKEPILKQCLTIRLTDKRILLVDDISDSGRSLQIAKKHLQQMGAKEIKIATLYAKAASITKPDYCEKLTNKWIVFPWDAKETVRKILEKNEGKSSIDSEISYLVKAGLPKHLVEKFLEEML